MAERPLTFKDIEHDQARFLDHYGISEEQFCASGVEWDELLKIGRDYESKIAEGGEYRKLLRQHFETVAGFEQVHSSKSRLKDTCGLLEKIVRKASERGAAITVDDYFLEITDLLGIRILYVFKDEYWPIHQQVMNAFGRRLSENVKLKLKEGDKEETYSELMKTLGDRLTTQKNETYRSIHYTVIANSNDADNSPRLEIQTRSLFEEGWSEINHRLVYKKGELDDSDLLAMSFILSQLVGTCDYLGSIMQARRKGQGEVEEHQLLDASSASANQALTYAEALRRIMSS